MSKFLIVSFSFFLQYSTMRLDLFSIAYLKMQELVSSCSTALCQRGPQAYIL